MLPNWVGKMPASYFTSHYLVAMVCRIWHIRRKKHKNSHDDTTILNLPLFLNVSHTFLPSIWAPTDCQALTTHRTLLILTRCQFGSCVSKCTFPRTVPVGQASRFSRLLPTTMTPYFLKQPTTSSGLRCMEQLHITTPSKGESPGPHRSQQKQRTVNLYADY